MSGSNRRLSVNERKTGTERQHHRQKHTETYREGETKSHREIQVESESRRDMESAKIRDIDIKERDRGTLRGNGYYGRA